MTPPSKKKVATEVEAMNKRLAATVENPQHMEGVQRSENYEVQQTQQKHNQLPGQAQGHYKKQSTPLKEQPISAMSSPVSSLPSASPSPVTFASSPQNKGLVNQIRQLHSQGTPRQQEAMHKFVNQTNGHPRAPQFANNINIFQPVPIEQSLYSLNGHQALQQLANHIGARDAQSQILGLSLTMQDGIQRAGSSQTISFDRDFQQPPNEPYSSGLQPTNHLYPSIGEPVLQPTSKARSYMGSEPQNYSDLVQYPTPYTQYSASPIPQNFGGLPTPDVFQGQQMFAHQYQRPDYTNTAYSHGVISDSGKWGHTNGYGTSTSPPAGRQPYMNSGCYRNSSMDPGPKAGYSPADGSDPHPEITRSQSTRLPTTPTKGSNKLPGKPGRFSPTTKPLTLASPLAGLPPKPPAAVAFTPTHKRTQSNGSPKKKKGKFSEREQSPSLGKAKTQRQELAVYTNSPLVEQAQTFNQAAAVERSHSLSDRCSQSQSQNPPVDHNGDSFLNHSQAKTPALAEDANNSSIGKSQAVNEASSIEYRRSLSAEFTSAKNQVPLLEKTISPSNDPHQKQKPRPTSPAVNISVGSHGAKIPATSMHSRASSVTDPQVSAPPTAQRCRASSTASQTKKPSPPENTRIKATAVSQLPPPKSSHPAGRTRAPSFGNLQQINKPTPASQKSNGQNLSPPVGAANSRSLPTPAEDIRVPSSELPKLKNQNRSHERKSSPNGNKRSSSTVAAREKKKQGPRQGSQIRISSPHAQTQTPSNDLPKKKRERLPPEPESQIRSSPPPKRARIANSSATQSEQERSSSSIRGPRMPQGGASISSARPTPEPSGSSSPSKVARRQHATWPPTPSCHVAIQDLVKEYPPPLTAEDVVAQGEYMRLFEMAQDIPSSPMFDEAANIPFLDVGEYLRGGNAGRDPQIIQNPMTGELGKSLLPHINTSSNLHSLITSENIANAWSSGDPQEERLKKVFLKTFTNFRGAAEANPHRTVNQSLTRYHREHPVPDFQNTPLGKLQIGMQISASWDYPMFGEPLSRRMIDEEKNGCTFCLYECDYGISDESVWLPLEASGGYCHECHLSSNEFALQWDDWVLSQRNMEMPEDREKDRQKWARIKELQFTHNTPALKELGDDMGYKNQAFSFYLQKKGSPKAVMMRRASTGSAARSPSSLSSSRSSAFIISNGSPNRTPGISGLNLGQGSGAINAGSSSTVITSSIRIPGPPILTAPFLPGQMPPRAPSPIMIDPHSAILPISEMVSPNLNVQKNPSRVAHPQLLPSPILPDMVQMSPILTSPTILGPQILSAPSLPNMFARATSPTSIDSCVSNSPTSSVARPKIDIRPPPPHVKTTSIISQYQELTTMGPPPAPTCRTFSSSSLPPMKPLLTKHFDGVPFCRACPWRRLDESKARICKPCRDTKWSIIKHTRHQDFELLSTIPRRVDEKGYPLLEDAKRRSCMICPKLAVSKCRKCPLVLCSDCEVMLGTLCKGEISGLLIHLDRIHLRNDAYLLSG